MRSGVPTVVDLATITDDCLDIFIDKLQEKGESNDKLNKLKEDDNYEGIKEALIPDGYNKVMNDLTEEEIGHTHRQKAWKELLEKINNH